MKKHPIARALALCLLCLLCLPRTFAAAAEDEREQPVLYIYTWLDYFDHALLREFEQAYGCRLDTSYFESNEDMYSSLKTGGGGYDIVMPSSYMSSIMQGEGMLLPLNHRLLPNLENIDKSFTRHTEDPEMVYAVPYTRTVTGVGYNRRHVDTADLGGWNIFDNPDYAGEMTMLDDMREALGAALKHCGYSINSTDETEIARARDVLARWKKNLARFGVDEAKNGLVEGEFIVSQGYNGDIALIMEEAADIGFYVPAEGSSLAADDFVILADSPYPQLAHAFINFMLEPETARRNMESIRYYMPNPKAVALLDTRLRDNPVFNVPPEIMDKCEVIRNLGAENAKYVAAWEGMVEEE